MPIRIGVSYIRQPSGQNYLEALREAGAEPVVLATPETCPQWPTEDDARKLFDPANPAVRRVDELDGLLLTGGGDIDPMLYREEIDGSDEPNWPRDHLEMAQFRRARARGMPILGICRGIQFLNVAMGGGLIQHLASSDSHRDRSWKEPRGHLVQIDGDSALARILSGEPAQGLVVGVNSYHHQALSTTRLAPGLVATGRSLLPEDEAVGVVEAVETTGTRTGQEFILGVQWHPERKTDPAPRGPGQPIAYSEMSNRLFRAFVEAAERRVSGG